MRRWVFASIDRLLVFFGHLIGRSDGERRSPAVPERYEGGLRGVLMEEQRQKDATMQRCPSQPAVHSAGSSRERHLQPEEPFAVRTSPFVFPGCFCCFINGSMK